MARSFPLAGRADGGNEKSRMTVKNLPIPITQKPTRISAFMRHLEDFASSAAPQHSYFIWLFSVYQEQVFESKFQTKKVFVFAQNLRRDGRRIGISE